MSSKKIMVLVEGPKNEVKLMKHLFSLYGIDEEYEIVSYCTNIYTLYKCIFDEYGGSQDVDLNQLLKSKEKDKAKHHIFDQRYTDTILVFDLEPQDPEFSSEKIMRMCDYFDNSSDNGMLYLNYPMIEAFWHMKSIPDPDFYTYYASITELKNRKYKQRVHDECRNGDPSKFAATRKECTVVILQNIRKAQALVNYTSDDLFVPDMCDILAEEIKLIDTAQKIAVLCTCVFFIADYNPALLGPESE